MGLLDKRRAPTKVLPPTDRLRRLLDYDPEMGVLAWKRQEGPGRKIFGFNNKCAGKVAGTITKSKHGYRVVGISGDDGKLRFYLAQRLIWKWMTGEEPEGMVDHRDLDRLNNRWSNLRAATHGQNKANSKPHSRSGFKGVYWSPRHKKWRAVVSAFGKINHVGHYDDIKVAAVMRHEAALRLQGDFARTV